MSESFGESRERWQRIEEIYGRALTQEGDARRMLLDEVCAGDAAVRRDVESLLACTGSASEFLETPALDIAALRLSCEPDADLIGKSLGAYLIEGWIGSGGMGDVYRALDTRLNRRVALKVLPALFAFDADRLARFRHEAQVLAALNHPHIAAIYGFEEMGGVQALVLELVEGATLAERAAQRPIGVDEALLLGCQIAEALEAAHDQGIVHCDLKPANITVRSDGTVKVLDFGLAKAMEPLAATADASPDGGIFGTAAYMSPEQARGSFADKRSDVWAFGIVLYEMLSGQRAYHDGDVAETLEAVARGNIDWSALSPATPASVRSLLTRCLDRDVKRRLRDIREARIVLENPAAAEPSVQAATSVTPSRPYRRRTWALILALTAGALIAGGVWKMKRSGNVPSPIAHFQYTLPGGESIALPASRHVIALSPDGSHLAYIAKDRVYLRPMAELTAHAIPGTEFYRVVTEPVFSPDGRSLIFWAGSDSTIKRIAITGGGAVTICRAANPHGMSWSPEGILFGQGDKGIMRVSAAGGTPQVLVHVREGEEAHGPQLLPDGKHVLFTLATGRDFDRWDRARIIVQSLVSGERKTLIEGGTDARYAPTGHLVYGSGAGLLAVAFDASSLTVRSGPVPLVQGVRHAYGRETGAALFSLSQTGSLAYIAGGATGPESGAQQIVYTDSNGSVRVLPLPPGPYQGGPRVSPDGTRIAFGADDGKEAIVWLYELAAGKPMQRLTFGGNNRFPIWSADGQRVAFQSDREGDAAIFWQRADGSGTAERLTTARRGEAHVPESWSAQGDRFLFDVATGSDISLWTYSVADRRAAPFGDVHSSMTTGAAFSPDGRWVAYTTSEGGMARMAIYVQPFPATGARYQLVVQEHDDAPRGSPHKPVWSPDGKGLYYVPRLGGFELVDVQTEPAFRFGQAVSVPRPFAPGAPNFRRLFDVTPDGGFVGLQPMSSANPAVYTTAPRIDVVLNWFEELRTRVPPLD